MNENKALKGEVESLKSKLAKDAMGDVMNQVEEVKGVKFIADKPGRCRYERPS